MHAMSGAWSGAPEHEAAAARGSDLRQRDRAGAPRGRPRGQAVQRVARIVGDASLLAALLGLAPSGGTKSKW